MRTSDQPSSSSGGVGFFGLLAILFIGLKLGNVIQWPWWQVLSPLWVPVAFVLVIFAFVFLIVAVVKLTGGAK